MEKTEAAYEILPVNQLVLDLKNPRIAKWMEMYDEVNDEAIRLAVGAAAPPGQDALTGPSYSTLKEAIRTSGGLIHPIIVNREPNGTLLVIEGNTRTLIYRELQWDSIPAMVYKNMSEAEIDAIRLQAHLVGTREWSAYAKAKYLCRLRENEHLTFGELVDFCGGKRRDVEESIQAYRDMEQYYRNILESDDQFDHSRFSAFRELQRQQVQEALISSGYSKDDFSRWVNEGKFQRLETRWVNEGKFQRLETVRQLPRILGNETSKEVFLKDGAIAAIKTLDMLEKPPSTNLQESTLQMLVTEIYNRINAIPWSDIQRLRSTQALSERDLYYDARDVLTSFCKDIGDDIE